MMHVKAVCGQHSGEQGHWQHIKIRLSEVASCCSNWASKMQPKGKRKAMARKRISWPLLGLCRPHAPPLPKVWMGQLEGLSDCVMATSVRVLAKWFFQELVS